MASTTSLSKTKIKNYSWDNALFAWDNVTALRSWEESYSVICSLLASEDMLFSEKNCRLIGLNKKEQAGVSEKSNNVFNKILGEKIIVAENYLDFIGYILKIQEMLSFKEVNPKTVRMPFSETVAVTGRTWRECLLNIAELLDIAETYNRKMQILQQESVNISDNLANHYGKIVFEAATLLDQSPYFIINKAVLEDLTVFECYHDFIGYIVRIQEAISFAEVCAKGVKIDKKEALQLTGHIVKSALKAASELFVLTDNVKSTNIFKRVFIETLLATEKMAKSMGVTKREFLNMAEAYIRNANTILSDLVFMNKDMTLEEFSKISSSPTGYESFKDMQVGEYEYQNALIRVLIEAGALSVRPQVTEWELNIDIPDTVDRGQAVIPASSHTILFNKHYYKPPEVQVTLKGGSVFNATPSVTAIRTDGFDVVIKDSNGNLIAGVISWTSTGY